MIENIFVVLKKFIKVDRKVSYKFLILLRHNSTNVCCKISMINISKSIIS